MPLGARGRSKTHLRLAIGRIRLLRNKKQVGMQGLRREIAELLASGKEDSARIRVEAVHREENLLVAFELLELFSELLSVRIAMIAQERSVPDDMREAVASVIYAAQRLPEIPELVTVRGCLAQKYSKEFAMQCNSPATCEEKGVSPKFVQALSVAAPSGAHKFDLLVGIAAEFGVAWDADDAAVRFMGSLHEAIGAPPDPEEVDQLADELVAAAQDAVRLDPSSAGEEKVGTSTVEEDALTAALARQGQGGAGPCLVSGKPVYKTAAEAAEVAEAAARVARHAADLAAELARQEAAAGGGAGGAAAKPLKPSAPPLEDSSSLDGLSKRFDALKKR